MTSFKLLIQHSRDTEQVEKFTAIKNRMVV